MFIEILLHAKLEVWGSGEGLVKADCELSVLSLITAAAMRSRLLSRSLHRLPKHTSDHDLRARKGECIS